MVTKLSDIGAVELKELLWKTNRQTYGPISPGDSRGILRLAIDGRLLASCGGWIHSVDSSAAPELPDEFEYAEILDVGWQRVVPSSGLQVFARQESGRYVHVDVAENSFVGEKPAITSFGLGFALLDARKRTTVEGSCDTCKNARDFKRAVEEYRRLAGVMDKSYDRNVLTSGARATATLFGNSAVFEFAGLRDGYSFPFDLEGRHRYVYRDPLVNNE